MRSTRLVILVLAMTAAACSGDAATDTSTDGTAEVTTTAAKAPAPAGVPLIDGLEQLEVLGPPATGAGEVPLFSWQAVTGAATYDLAILTSAGPLWAWSGAATEIRLGGLPFDRPEGVAGPVLVAGSCWSVVARDTAGHITAASDFFPVSPGESNGHSCEPGSLP